MPSLVSTVSNQSFCVSWMDPKEVGFCTLRKGDTPCIGFWAEPDYEQFTHVIIAAVCLAAKSYFNPSQRIYVDADASDGLWDSLGFHANPHYDFTEEQRNWEGAGYEKYILFSDLCTKMGV